MSPPTSRKRVTIRDVARVARVSHQTVSRFINGENHIAPLTRTRVEQAIAKLRFHPSHIARSLVSRQTKTVGLVMGDVASPFFPDVARGAEDELAAAGYSLILSSSRRDPERERRNVKHLLERSTDGLILGAPQCPPEELAELAQRAGRPDGVPEPRGEGAPRRGGVDRLADRHHRGGDVPRRSGAPTDRAGRPVAERRAGRQPRGLVPARPRSRRARSRARAGLPGRDVARGRARRRPASPGGRAPPDRGHLPQRRDGDRAAPGLRRASPARARGPVHRRVGRRAVREPRHAPAHHRARAPVRARPGRGAKAARADGRPTRRARRSRRWPSSSSCAGAPGRRAEARPESEARPEAADPPAKGGARRARRRSSSVSSMVARPVETLRDEGGRGDP